MTPQEHAWLRREARAPFGWCFWHPDTPRLVGIRRNDLGAFKGTYPYCPVCRPDGATTVVA